MHGFEQIGSICVWTTINTLTEGIIVNTKHKLTQAAAGKALQRRYKDKWKSIFRDRHCKARVDISHQNICIRKIYGMTDLPQGAILELYQNVLRGVEFRPDQGKNLHVNVSWQSIMSCSQCIHMGQEAVVRILCQARIEFSVGCGVWFCVSKVCKECKHAICSINVVG